MTEPTTTDDELDEPTTTDDELDEPTTTDDELDEPTTTDDESREGSNAATDDPADTTEQKLRRQAQRYRLRARDASSKAEHYARELFTARLAALDVLADPSDMTFDLELLDEPDALAQAVAELVKRKPHLAKRLASGDIGQGAGAGGNPGDVSLVSLINGTGRAR